MSSSDDQSQDAKNAKRKLPSAEVNAAPIAAASSSLEREADATSPSTASSTGDALAAGSETISNSEGRETRLQTSSSSTSAAPPAVVAAAAPEAARIGITPTSEDILCGRAFPYHMHPGNHKMYRLVEENKEKYRNLDRSQKSALVKEILRTLRKQGSRFLIRRDGSRGTDINEGVWEVASRGDAYEKVCHALRGKSGKSDKSSDKKSSITSTGTKTACGQKQLDPSPPGEKKIGTASINNSTAVVQDGQQAAVSPASGSNFFLTTQLGVLAAQQQQQQQLNNLLPSHHQLGLLRAQLLLSADHVARLENASLLAALNTSDMPRNPRSVRPTQTTQNMEREAVPHRRESSSAEVSRNPERMQPESTRELPAIQTQERENATVGAGNRNNDNNREIMDDVSVGVAESLPPDTDPAILLALTSYLRRKRRRGN